MYKMIPEIWCHMLMPFFWATIATCSCARKRKVCKFTMLVTLKLLWFWITCMFEICFEPLLGKQIRKKLLLVPGGCYR